MMKRFSIYFLFATLIFTGATGFDYFSNRHEWANYYKRWSADRADNLTDEAAFLEAQYETRKNLDEVIGYLESRRRLKAIDLWAIYRNNQMVQTGMTPEDQQPGMFDLDVEEWGIYKHKNGRLIYSLVNSSDGYQFVIGTNYNLQEFLDSSTSSSKAIILRYCLGILLMAMAVFVFLFRDFRRSVMEMVRGGGVRKYSETPANSLEADQLIRGLSSMENQKQQLAVENKMFSDQVLPSLRTEMTSGRQPPYDFMCTLVRTDINNFSKIYNENSVDEFAATINEFFTDVSHIVSRYQGLVHEFIGDEVIFYFKDSDCGNSIATAMSAIRDINARASHFNKMTLEQRGYPFTVKSSLAHGSLRFGRFVNGFNLAGPSLIETVRILAHVQEKSGNLVVFDQRHQKQIDFMVSTEAYAEVKLKGFHEKYSLVAYVGHKAIEKNLEELSDEKTFDDLPYYRSDEDICAMMNWARLQTDHLDERLSVVLRMIGILRRIPVSKSGHEVHLVLLAWLDDLIRATEGELERGLRFDQLNPARLRTLASAIKLFGNLVPKEEFTAGCRTLLERALELRDRRVIANALDVLTLFQREEQMSLVGHLARHEDNRIAANALILEGQRMISPFVIKQLKRMVTANHHSTVASGLFAIGEIARFHRQKDPVYFNTQISFHRLAESLVGLMTHEDARVRFQTMAAINKFAEPELSMKAWEFVRQAGEGGLQVEAREHLARVVAKDGVGTIDSKVPGEKKRAA